MNKKVKSVTKSVNYSMSKLLKSVGNDPGDDK